MNSFATGRLKRNLTSLILVLAALSLAGCLTVGKSFDTHGVELLKIGKTTQEEVERLFGPPWRTGIEDGERTWTYGHYRYYLLGPAHTTDLVIRFSPDGVVRSYTYNTTEASSSGPAKQNCGRRYVCERARLPNSPCTLPSRLFSA